MGWLRSTWAAILNGAGIRLKLSRAVVTPERIVPVGAVYQDSNSDWWVYPLELDKFHALRVNAETMTAYNSVFGQIEGDETLTLGGNTDDVCIIKWLTYEEVGAATPTITAVCATFNLTEPDTVTASQVNYLLAPGQELVLPGGSEITFTNGAAGDLVTYMYLTIECSN